MNKENLIKKLASFLIILVCLFTIFSSKLYAYNRNRALEYIDIWWDSDLDDDGIHEHINPLYTEYYDVGGDCANFASQVLINGGIRFGTYGYGVGGTIPGAENLRVNLRNHHGANEYLYLHDSIKEGDIIFWTNSDTTPDADHTLEVRIRAGSNIYTAAHDNDRPGTRIPDDNPNYFLPGIPVLAYQHIS